MSGFDSPNFKKTVQNPNQRPMREFNVLPPEMENQKFEQANKISSFGKQRLEFLANLCRSSKDVEIEGTTFSLRTLKGYENKEVIQIAYGLGNTNIEVLFEGRRQRLARSIFKIDGSDIDMILGSSTMESKLEMIDNLEENVIQKLSVEFDALNQEVNTKFSISTEADIKEVTEDLKK